MKNQEIARIFYEVADLLEMQKVAWKPRAYRNAARALDDSDDVEVLYRKGGKKALMDIPGIGANLADKIIEYITTGKISEYEQLRKKLPEGVHEMMHVMGLGPKKAWRLYKELKITGISQLRKAAEAGRIRKLSGFGAKSEEDILKGIETMERTKGRMLLGTAWRIADDIVSRLGKLGQVMAIEPAGSLRRRKETIGDIDILVVSARPAMVMDAFTKMPGVERVIARGLKKSSVLLRDGIGADVRVVEQKSFGSALQYFTGGKEHNIALRQIAIKKGLKLNEYGLFSGKRQVAGKSEQEIYRALGLRYIEPELRENTGEIEAAEKGRLPELVPYGSVKGDLHVHSTWSDGTAGPEEMIKAALKKGYEYVAITDHSQSEHIANGMDERHLLKYIDEISALKKKYSGRIGVLAGSEVSILADGRLDYPGRLLEKLDLVVGAVHSRFRQPGQEMTRRVIAAIESGYVNVLGHPTGRLIGSREACEIDFDRVFVAAKANNVALEINSFPERLDLRDVHVRAAVENGVSMVVDTDAHHQSHLDFIDFGIAQARRGWAEAGNIINTLPWKKLERNINR